MFEHILSALPLPEPSPALLGRAIAIDLANEKRRLECICRDAGLSRSVAKTITRLYFEEISNSD